ncbi:response regulator transcription factor [Chakrabartyella piscis]|uniref:response regulator transcription factor n=1 Tax=Chakrabartyella piscis TaxID=2918914 RepID=UPI0029587127|nr:response regulator transcription factor [Chakrabartyella piscis]
MVNGKICIMVVDDDTRMVRGISDSLRFAGYEVMSAGNGEEALEVFYEQVDKIDLILLDVMMPVRDGYYVLSTIRDERHMTPIIMLTAKDEEYDQLRGFRLGADDYIGKPFSISLLLARIEAVMKRSGKLVAEDLVVGGIAINISKRSCVNDGTTMELTKREFELLYFFLLHPSLIFTREHLLNQVWGYDFEGDSRTVDTHIKQLRIKLGEKSTYIKTVHRVGYKFEV